jgi:hypothetical protein
VQQSGPSFQSLLEDTQSRNSWLRVRAAEHLDRFGPEAVDPLIALLQDERTEVRISAARALGRVGDERALQPLLQTLRQSFWGGNGWSNLLIGGLVAVGVALLILGFLRGFNHGGAWWWVIYSGGLWRSIAQRRQQRSQLVGVVTEAITNVAERHPTPELGLAVGDLNLAAADHVRNTAETRAASRRAAQRIQELVQEVRTLPVTSAPPGVDEASLPVPALNPEPEAELLPRITQ